MKHSRFARSVLLVLAVASGMLPAGARSADAQQGKKKAAILVSLEQRYLWYVVNGQVLFQAPVAIGTGENFTYDGKSYKFTTPRGTRTIVKKEKDPIWTVPDWHYFEKASLRGLKLLKIQSGEIYPLADGTMIVMRGDQVGRVNQFGNFWPFTPGIEIIFDNILYMPPMNSAQRRVPEVLGPFKLDMGNGYLIHGTNEYTEETIGRAASHGCIRMNNDDVTLLYQLVPIGTAVFIS